MAILGVLVAVAIPNVSNFIGKGKTESYETELHNIQTAVMTMLAESTTGLLTPVTTATDDMDTVQTTDDTPLVLSGYVTGLNTDGTVKSGCTYKFTADGTIVQTMLWLSSTVLFLPIEVRSHPLFLFGRWAPGI